MTAPSSRTKELESYSGLDTAKPNVYCPADLRELREVFDHAKKHKRKVTLRAGGHAFDSQSLGADIVVSMKRFNEIDVVAAKRQVRVGAGATWGAIVAKLEPHGLVPAGTVTASHATAGGTLAADCLSRWSPRYGKEGGQVERFSLLTIQGVLLDCSRPPPGTAATKWTLEQRVFMAAIGGFGYLGAFVEITYNVLSIGQPRIGVETRVAKYTTFRELARELVPATGATVTPSQSKPQWDAISAGLYPAGRDTPSSMVFTSRFTTTLEGRRFLLYEPNNPLRIAAEWIMRVPVLCALLSRIFFRLTRNNQTYINELANALFFMDANARAKRIAKRFGRTLKTVQQTFVVPIDVSQADDLAKAQDDLCAWLQLAHDLFDQRKLTPTLQDVLFLPEDLSFCLSPNARSPGFAVSYAFETSNPAKITRVKRAFTDLADLLWNRFGGHVSMVKCVYVDPDTLQNMYRSGADEFFHLKRQLDPDCILRNQFLEENFPNLMRDAGCV